MKRLKTYQIFNESQINITQFEEDKAFISDTLLELQDRGFGIRIGHDGIARSFSSRSGKSSNSSGSIG